MPRNLEMLFKVKGILRSVEDLRPSSNDNPRYRLTLTDELGRTFVYTTKSDAADAYKITSVHENQTVILWVNEYSKVIHYTAPGEPDVPPA